MQGSTPIIFRRCDNAHMRVYVCGWSQKQACVALSSAEAELIALTTGLKDQASISLHVHTDSEAARCIEQESYLASVRQRTGSLPQSRRYNKPSGLVEVLFTTTVGAEVMQRLLPLPKLQRVGTGDPNAMSEWTKSS
eukprot:4302884-Amphidinium_carterae.5